MRIPARAMASGMPTAQPTMMGVFDFFSSVGEGPAVDDEAGTWVVIVDTMVVKPALPEETLLMVDVIGVDDGAGVLD